ncbi:MAG: ATP-binding protein [Pseudodesulfovibrio sp.]
MEKRVLFRSRLVLPLGLGILWLLFLLVLAIWSVRSERAHVASMAEREARAFFQQIVVTRAWNAAHGGVYVLSTPENPPNPYLPEEDRTVETVQGVTLTKVNPAYMTRQISAIAKDDHEVQFHITSLDPIRPENVADEWEVHALQEFKQGAEDKFEMVGTPKGLLFRYMAPLKTEKECMRCHAQYGHVGKSILGGISVTFSAAPLIQTRKSSVAQTHLAFSLIFLVGFVGICGSTYMVQTKREEAEKANRTKSVFLANMSHDMRTPLNGIMGMTELMQKKGLGQTQGRYADMVRHSAWTLLEIVTDITDFSRLESGRLELANKPFDVRDTLDDALKTFRFESGNRGLILSGTVAQAVPRFLKGDAFRLKQIIANLVGNAVKFTPDGSVTVRITLDSLVPCKTDDHEQIRLKVAVQDTGIGIPADEQADIFESFRQVDDSYAKKHEGSGLGLAICRQLVTMMGGSISVESTPDTGSTFSFNVVLAMPDETESVEAAIQPQVDAPISSPCRVLVAEDNLLNQTFAMEILEEAGHPVTIAENGLEALEKLRNNEFDLVFMDVQMPEMDGLEATRRIRAGEAGEHARSIPIIAATAFAVRGDKEKCMESGMNGYVVKPMESRDLLMAVALHSGSDTKKSASILEKTVVKPDDIIDVEAALERLGGRRELFNKLIVTFLDDTPPKLADLADHVADGNMNEVLRLAHGLKNSAGMIQAVAMTEIASAIEMAVREDRLTEIPELMDTLKVTSDAAMIALTHVMEA